MTLNICQAGHQTHESKLVEALYGPLWIWDWEQYQGQAGSYCPGQDEVSKSIDLQDVWEMADTAYFWKVLGEQPGTVLDFGSHIGWFTLLALMRGCQTFAFDADPENMRLLDRNAYMRGLSTNLTMTIDWTVDAVLGYHDHVRIMKVDIEGHEHEALNLTRHLWQERKIDFGLWELSPIFEKRPGIMAESYAALVDEIASYGYRWHINKDGGEWAITGKDLTFPQENGWAVKIP